MFTLIESPIFSKRWPDYWSEDERGNFAAWLALNPEAGDIVRRAEPWTGSAECYGSVASIRRITSLYPPYGPAAGRDL